LTKLAVHAIAIVDSDCYLCR